MNRCHLWPWQVAFFALASQQTASREGIRLSWNKCFCFPDLSVKRTKTVCTLVITAACHLTTHGQSRKINLTSIKWSGNWWNAYHLFSIFLSTMLCHPAMARSSWMRWCRSLGGWAMWMWEGGETQMMSILSSQKLSFIVGYHSFIVFFPETTGCIYIYSTHTYISIHLYICLYIYIQIYMHIYIHMYI